MTHLLCSLIVLGASLGWQKIPAGSRDIALERHEFHETHMGSEFKLILYSTDEPAAIEASHAAFERIESLNRAYTDYEPDSELNRLGDAAGGPPVPISADLLDILQKSQAFAERSHGTFDPTIKPLVKLWRHAFRQKVLPPPAELEAARKLVDYRKLSLDPKHRTARLEQAGMRLDLGGIAKGYAGDEAQKVLKAHGISSALVAAAGDIVVSDPPPGEPAWRVGIGPLDDPLATPTHVLLLKNAAVSTSGDTERYAEIAGKRYAHIVDPHTGYGVVDRATATVVAPDGTTSDTLATVVYLLGPEKGLDFLAQYPGTSGLFLRRTDQGLREWTTPGWHEAAPAGESTGAKKGPTSN